MLKEKYFTCENIAAAGASLAAQLPRNPRAAACSPAGAALLVIDMQGYFLNPAARYARGAAIVPTIQSCSRHIESGPAVYFTAMATAPAMPGKWPPGGGSC
jgi:isochorismate hydrolase